MYEMKLENGVEGNLKEWQESDQLTKSIEQAAADKGVNISLAVTEENMNKLSTDAATTASTSIRLGVLCRGQERDIYCGEASIQMISLYYGKPTPTQTSIYNYFFDSDDDPAGLNPSEIIEWANINGEKQEL